MKISILALEETSAGRNPGPHYNCPGAGGSLPREVADVGAAGAVVQAVLKGWRDASRIKSLLPKCENRVQILDALRHGGPPVIPAPGIFAAR